MSKAFIIVSQLDKLTVGLHVLGYDCFVVHLNIKKLPYLVEFF